ncbi:sugar ABC transporter ATP-binding protein [Inquilinus sp. NPDC058860]|uniref:sugar ABC transporter ATP-binding protein n=1 Tax=Inquilinus sp. NPDC058860 TaxID=3346652 RepID=UPI0036CE9328
MSAAEVAWSDRSAGTPAVIAAEGISKSFAGVEVLRGIDLALAGGEIHALLGENGAGKSTFARILAGVHRPSAGRLLLQGRAVEIGSPLEAQRLGITLIHQEPISFPHLSVAENLFIGGGGGGPFSRVRWRGMAAEARRLMDDLGVAIDVGRPTGGLSIADQQMVEIARALAADSRLILMDEPTAPLTPREVETLFAIVRRLRDEGRAVVFISHRLEEVRALCDRVTIFRDGERVATAPAADLPDGEIIRLMIGRPLKAFLHKEKAAIGETALEVEGLGRAGRFAGIGFTLRRGEVLGMAGLVGAGRTDVARALFGIAPADRGRIKVKGREVAITDPARAIGLGLAYVPEDRAAAGIFRSLPVDQNITAAAPGRIARRGVISPAAERAAARGAIDKLRIRLASPRQPIGELSGGNQQKAILARWLMTDPEILILDEPTRGIDIGVKAEFYDMINALAADGRAILLISSELPELLTLSDRILVMSEGRLTAEFSRAEATQEAIMAAAVPRSRVETGT